MKPFRFLVLTIVCAFLNACSNSNETGAKSVVSTPCISQLPNGYSLLADEKIIDLSDLDGDGKGEAFAFCMMEGKMEGFAMHFSKSNRMVYSEFEEFSGWGESISRKAKRLDNKIIVVGDGLFINDSIVLSFDEVSQEVFFESMKFSYYTRDHELSKEGNIYFENGSYFHSANGVKSSKPLPRLKMDQSAEFLSIAD